MMWDKMKFDKDNEVMFFLYLGSITLGLILDLALIKMLFTI